MLNEYELFYNMFITNQMELKKYLASIEDETLKEKFLIEVF